MISEFLQFCIYLGLEYNECNRIDRKRRDIDDQIMEMLQKWLCICTDQYVPSFVVAVYGITSMAHTNTAIEVIVTAGIVNTFYIKQLIFYCFL